MMVWVTILQLCLHYLLGVFPRCDGCDGTTCFVYSAPPSSLVTKRRLHNYLIRNLTGSMMTCLDACAMDCRCMSFNLIDKVLCQLNFEDNETVPLVIDDQSSYYNIEVSTLSTKAVSHCDDVCCMASPCENGGKCEEICDHPRKRFNCTCSVGYTGRLCQINIDDCTADSCLNGGSCIDGVNQFTCKCTTGYSGQFCEIAESKTCTDLKNNGYTTSKYYSIDPDGDDSEPAFTVYCNMTDKGAVGVTEISHNSEARTLVDGQACMHAGCYSRTITYINATMEQIITLIQASASCEQFIQYECLSSNLLEKSMGWWVSRNNMRMNYWGGAEKGSGKCACGMSNSCADTAMPCNCDTPDSVWHEDSGFLTYTEDLPVTQLRFGDVDKVNEKGYHTLGKLRCYGNK